MAATIAAMDNAHIPDPVFDRTARTWEVELLISSVAVFAMLQLPGWLDDRMFDLEPRAGDEWRMVLLLAYLYAKSAAVVLAITFAMHLLLRAQWIALVGMHSVYPDGIRLDRLRMGPIQRAVEEARPDSTTDAIERADNRASVVFAIGVTVALIIAAVCVSFCGALLLATLLTQALGWKIDPLKMMVAVFAIVIGPFAIAGGLDQWLGARVRPGGLVHRVLAATLRFYTRIGMGRRNNHILSILTSNGGESKMMAVVIGVMMIALVGVSTIYVGMRTGRMFGSYAQFPQAEALSVDPAHYDDQRDPGRDGSKPYLQSAVVTGPYLRLVVPYRPNRDEAAMRSRCAPNELKGDALAAARLACLQSLHGVLLDGVPLDPRYEIASDPRTDRPALLAMVDARALSPGRHELRIDRPARDARNSRKGESDRDPGFDRIVFWR